LAAQIDELPFIPPRARVVIIAGLPGDIESENAYREQMQLLLETVVSSGNAEKIISLSDFSESLNLPSAHGASFLKADRNNFQSLGESLSVGTNPVVVIVWGHGGR